jgi:hypothetical protein
LFFLQRIIKIYKEVAEYRDMHSSLRNNLNKIFLFLSIFLLLWGSKGISQTDTLNISWDRNPAIDSISYYILFRAASDQNTSFSLSDYDSILAINQTPPTINTIDTVDRDGAVIRPGYFISYRVIAVDSMGVISDYSDPKGVGLPQILWQTTTIDSGDMTTIMYSEFLNDLDDDVNSLNIVSSQEQNVIVSTSNSELFITPDPVNYSGTASFRLTATDDEGFWDRRVINLNIVSSASPNTRPLAEDDQAITNQGSSIDVNVLVNDIDPDGDPLILELFSPAHGSVIDNHDSTVTYTPDSSFYGTDSFEYAIHDGRGGRDTASVTIMVSQVPVESAETLIAFPNPYRASLGHEKFVLEPLPLEAKEIVIVSAAGKIVFEETLNPTQSRRFEWNVKNKSQQQVASGLYIYVIRGGSGERIASGKIAIIR